MSYRAPASNQAVHRLHHHLEERSIHFFNERIMQVNIFEALIRSLNIPNPEDALRKILKREEIGPTLISPRISMPHARIDGLNSIVAALGIHPAGLQAAENKLNVFVLFFSPTHQTTEHLNFLAGVSSLFQTEGLTEKLLHLTAPPGVLQLIRETETSL